MNALFIALRGKGIKNAVRRMVALIRNYGWTARRMSRILERFGQLLHQFDCAATWPITAVALSRNDAVIRRMSQQGNEFAIHGHTHVDHSDLEAQEQIERIGQAMSLFARSQIPVQGFRGPYLRWNQGTLDALRHYGLLYECTQALIWDAGQDGQNESWRRALEFYRALPASKYPSLPHIDQGLVRIPYSLPDDEALVDRLRLPSGAPMAELWQSILQQTWQLGEVFVLGLHPERFEPCEQALRSTLLQAQKLMPSVWIARLDEIARWWLSRCQTQVQMDDLGNRFHVTVQGDRRVALLARNAIVSAATEPWYGAYRRVLETDLMVDADIRPWVGLAPDSPTALADFLWQQGYLVEVDGDRSRYAIYLDQPQFSAESQRTILADIEQSPAPLIRLSTWPDGARSALSITGDIDALTLWDYARRLIKQ